MIPTRGRIVNYRLSSSDVQAIKLYRESNRLYGNNVAEGDEFPMMIVAVWGSTEDAYVNGKVFLDGADTHWATSVKVGEGPHTWSWPTREA